MHEMVKWPTRIRKQNIQSIPKLSREMRRKIHIVSIASTVEYHNFFFSLCVSVFFVGSVVYFVVIPLFLFRNECSHIFQQRAPNIQTQNKSCTVIGVMSCETRSINSWGTGNVCAFDAVIQICISWIDRNDVWVFSLMFAVRIVQSTEKSSWTVKHYIKPNGWWIEWLFAWWCVS